MSKAEFNLDAYFDAMEKNVLAKLEQELPKEIELFITEYAYKLHAEAVKNTPRGETGDLQRGWEVGNVYKKGRSYFIDVYNNMEYADHVEHGHRQNVGQYVPAIGKRLKQPFIKGAHMMSISLAKLEKEAPMHIKQWFKSYIDSLKI